MRVAVLTNILNPYRTSFFRECNKYCKEQGDSFKVFVMVGEKSDRPWKYEQFETEYTQLLKSKTLLLHGIYFHFNSDLIREIRAYKPDVVVMAGTYIQPSVIKLTMKAKKYRYKTVFWSESHFNESRNYNRIVLALRNTIRKRVLGKFDAFWYPGLRARTFIEHYCGKNARLFQVANTVDNMFFSKRIPEEKKREIRKRFITNEGQKLIFTPAALRPVKGLVEFTDIIRHVDPERYTWIIAGEGPLKAELSNLAKENRVNLLLLGQKNQKEIRELYQSSDIFLLPSISDSNPLSSIEALWSGLPLLVSEHVGNAPELIKEGVNGYEFKYSEKKDAVGKLTQMIGQPIDWFIAAGEESRKIAEESFRVNDVAGRAMKGLMSLL